MWGAQGGKWGDVLGGKGGFSHGKYSINKATTIYVSVGGGEGKIWNGGGGGITGPAGGGATSVQTSLRSDGQLIYYETVKNTDVLIVAGGGGAGFPAGIQPRVENFVNQYGGGETGAKAWYDIGEDYDNAKYGQQATQTSGYAFGQGQSAPTEITSNSEIPGAGGGWYGGYTIIPTVASTFAAAGGGSGHIGTILTNGQTIAGNETIPSPTGGTEEGHSGNGYAKITWMPVL